MEDARDEKITGTIVALQAYCRGHLGRQKLKKLKVGQLINKQNTANIYGVLMNCFSDPLSPHNPFQKMGGGA